MIGKKVKPIVFLSVLLVLLLASCAAPADLNEPTQSDQNNAQTQDTNPLENTAGKVESTSKPSLELSEVSGDVKKRQIESQDFTAAGNGDVLLTGGEVQTGEDGRARLDFSDGTLVRVGPESLFTFEEVNTSQEGLLKRMFLQFGQLWVILNGGELEIDTPSGVASVRGSYLMVHRDEETGDIYATCLEGTCTLEFNGQQVVFGAGETAWITGGEGPETGYMTEEDIQDWLDNNPEAELVLDEVLSSVGDFVWEDLNGDGLQDADEPGVADVSVELYDNAGTLLDTTETGEDGAYLFEELQPGEYSLKFALASSMFTVQDTGEDEGQDSDANKNGETEVFFLPPGTAYTAADAGVVYPGQAGYCPLTGLLTDADLDLRPLFISMSMFPAQATRPLTGINTAPVVFETLIDEGQTRLQALFYCGYPEALPENNASSSNAAFDIRGVRSGRVFYAELSELFGAGLIFAGASSEVYDTISPYQCATAANKTPNDIGGAGVNVDRLQEIAADCQHRLGNTDLDVWSFGSPPSGGMAVDKFLMYYNYLNQTRWEYDSEAGGYVRYHNDPANPDEFPLSTDRLTGEATVRQNILLLEVPHNVLNRSGTIIDFELTDERGYGWLLRDGAMYKVCWSAVFSDYPTKSNRYRPFLLTDCETKEPVNLAYGSTWINIVDPSLWFDQNGDYYMAKQPFIGYGP